MNFRPQNVRLRRGGRAVDCAGLENRKAKRSREFESHPLRASKSYSWSCSYSSIFNESPSDVNREQRSVFGDYSVRARKNAKSGQHIEFPVPLRTQHRTGNARQGTFERTRSESGLEGTRGRHGGARRSRHQKMRSTLERDRRETRDISC